MYMIQAGSDTRTMRTTRSGVETVAITKFQSTGLPVTVWTDELPRPARRLRRPPKWSLVLYVGRLGMERR